MSSREAGRGMAQMAGCGGALGECQDKDGLRCQSWRGVKSGPVDFGLSTQELPVTKMRKALRRAGLQGLSGVCFGRCQAELPLQHLSLRCI